VNCPICQNPTTTIVNSRKRQTHVMRRRQCESCGHRFTTTEVVGDNPNPSDAAIRKLQTERDRAIGALYAIWSSGETTLSRIRSAIGIDSLTAIITETAQAKGKLKQKV